MPIVEVTLVEGRAPEELRAMIGAITVAVSETVAAPRESIRVIIREVPTTHFAAGDVTIAERRAGQLT
jgi:4-oxalocrotonate tautomerase